MILLINKLAKKNLFKSVLPDGAWNMRVEGYEHQITVRFPRIGLLPPSGRTVIMIIMILFTQLVSASPGCMDNSWHLARPFDNKEYHIVSHKIGKDEFCCQCSCRKLSLSRGQCLECGHKHEIQPWIIIRTPRAH